MGDFVLGDAIVWTLWFFLWMMAIWLVVSIVVDVFSDRELSGWGKAGWTVLIAFLPWLGALIYLIARGPSMNERRSRQAREQDEAMREYVRRAAGGTSAADELAKLAELHGRGVLSQAEFAQAKAAVLGGVGGASRVDA